MAMLPVNFESNKGVVEHQLQGTEIPNLQRLRDEVGRIFGGELDILNDDVPMRTSEDVLVAFKSHESAEVARRIDVLEAALESIRCALASSDVELQYQAIHGLWELTCDASNHKYVTYSMFEAAAEAVRSPELRVQSIAAAAVWRLAESEDTLARMPVADLVPALLHTLLTDDATKQSEPSAEDAAECARDAACAAESRDAGARRIRRTNTHSTSFAMLLPSAGVEEEDVEHDLQAARAVACTGYAIMEQRVWQAGGLLALLGAEAGRRAFHRTGVALRLLPLLEADDFRSPPPLKAACAALLARSAEVSPPVCKALLDGGLAQLVRLASASGVADGRTRQQASDLIRFALARVKLHPSRPVDAGILKELPAFVGELRASTLPLLADVRAYVRRGEPLSGASDADRSCVLLRSLIGCLWAMLAHLQATRAPLMLHAGWLGLATALLELSPERAAASDAAAAPPPTAAALEANACTARLTKHHGPKLRTACLGMLAALDAPTGGNCEHDGAAVLEARHPPPPPPKLSTPEPAAADSDENAPASDEPAEEPAPEPVLPASVVEQKAFERACAALKLTKVPSEPDDSPTSSAKPPTEAPSTSAGGKPVSRRSQMKGDAAPGGGGAGEKPEAHGALRGGSLRAARALAASLLDAIEHAVAPSRDPRTKQPLLPASTTALPTPAAGWRACECYGAALASLSGVAASALRHAGAVPRLIELLGALRGGAHRLGPKLTGYSRAAHGHLASILLSVASHGHPAVDAPLTAEALAANAGALAPASGGGAPASAAGSKPGSMHGSTPGSRLATAPPSQAASRPGSRPGTSKPGGSSSRAAAFVPLSRAQLERLVTELPLSAMGGTAVATLLWLHACHGHGMTDLLLEIGATEQLCAAASHVAARPSHS